MQQVEITVKALKEGGFVIAEGLGDDLIPIRAVTTLAEAGSAVRDFIEDRLAPQHETTCWQTGAVSMPKAITNVVPLRQRGIMDRIFGRG